MDDLLFAPPIIQSFSDAEIAAKQRADPVIQHIIAQLERDETPPTSLREEIPDLPLLLRELTRLELHNNVLVRRRNVGGEHTYQLVLPEECRPEVLFQLHDQMGHLGIERTLDLARSRFFWPRMSADVHNKIKTCERCVRRKSQPQRAAPLVNIKTTRPLELVCMDFLSLEPDQSRTKDVLVITDHFTKYAVAVPTPNQKAKTVAKSLWDNFLVHYGIPEKLHSDQGPDFESHTIKELCQMAGINKIRTTPYHPRGNPVERFNRTLLDMLGTLTEQDKTHWRDFVKPLVHAYNCTKNDVTGYTPYELMFGRQPRLPVDLAFGLPVSGTMSTSHSQYVEKLKSHLEESYRIATENSEKVMGRNKQRFDKNIKASELSVGDRVLVRNVRIRGKHKLADRWEPDVYLILKRAGTLPVYTVKPENKDRPIRTLHRDLLLPCGYLPATPSKPETQKQKPVMLKTPVIPTFPDSEEALSDDDLNLPELSISEPTRFTTVINLPNLPTSTPPVLPAEPTVISPGQPSQSTHGEKREIQAAEVDTEMEVGINPEPEPEHVTDSEPVAVLEAEESTSSDPEALEPLSVAPEPDSPSESEPPSPESEPAARRPARTRKPPDRLQYSKLGKPLLHSIQSLFHGLSTAFSSAFEIEEDLSPAPSCEPVVRRQPAACTGPYMSSGGEPVTRIY